MALALAAGVVFGRYVDLRGEIFYLCAVMIPLTFLIGRRFSEKPLPPYIFIAAALALYGGLSSSHAEFDEPGKGDIASYTERGPLDLEGQVVALPERQIGRDRMVVRVEKIHLSAGAFIPVTGRLQLSVKHGGKRLRYGDRIRFSSAIRPIVPYGNPGAFRVDRYYRYRQILTRAYVGKVAKIELLERGGQSAIWKAVESIRAAINSRLDAQLQSPQSEIVKALLIGESGAIPEEVRRIFRDAGVAHLLAISGLHMSVVASFVFAIVFFSLRRFPRLLLMTNSIKLAAAISLIPIIAFCLMAGARFSAIRAAIMIGIMLLAIVVDRHRDILSAVALAALVILIIKPVGLFDVGFQFSFAAVIAIILVVPRVTKWRQSKRAADPITEAFPTAKMKLGDWLIIAAATPLAAGIATAPISAWHFNGVSAYGLLSNIVLVPLYALFIIPACLVGEIVMPISITLSQIVFDAVAYAINTGHHMAKFIASIPGAYVRVGTPTMLEIAAMYGLMFSVLYWPRRKAVRAGAVACILVLIIVPAAYRVSDWMNRDLRFTLIDVGQGLSQLIEIPGGKKILIDGGGYAGSSFDVGEKVLASYLWKRRIKGLDLVVNTHPHPDHYLGLRFILDNFDVGEIWISGHKLKSDSEYSKMLRGAEQRSIPIEIVHDETAMREFGAALVEVYWPPTVAYNNPEYSLNDASIVLRLTWGEKSFLLGADIETKAEQMLIQRGNLASDVLVVGHHGGKTSSTPEFVRAVRPRFALIPVGRGNRYGHPVESVLARFRSARASIFRTDENGRIRCVSDGVEVRCKPFWTKKKDDGPTAR